MRKYANFTALKGVFNTLGLVLSNVQDIGVPDKKRALYAPFTAVKFSKLTLNYF
ncbi:hypothetical protein DSECCO2_337740 [anaerobic digester metagenome]